MSLFFSLKSLKVLTNTNFVGTFEEKPATNLQQIRKQRRRKSKCGKKFGRKCLRRQQKNKKMLKMNKLPKKFAKSKVSKFNQ